MTDREIIRHNWRICLVFAALSKVFFGGSVMTTYYLEMGLSQAQIYILQTVLAVVSLSVDILFGSLADRIGTGRVMLIGSIIWIAQSIGFAFAVTFPQFVLGLVGTGLYLAALSNTYNSVMMLSIKKVGNKKVEQRLYRHFLAACTRWGQGGYIFGIVAGGLMVHVGDIATPYAFQVLSGVACLLCAIRIIEPHGVQEHASRSMIKGVLRLMLIERRDIRYLVMLNTGFQVFGLLVGWILQPRMKQAGIPVWAYAGVYVLWSVLIMVFAGGAKHADVAKTKRLWLCVVIVPPIGAVVGGLNHGMVGFLALMIGMVLIAAYANQLYNSFLNEALPDDGVRRNTELAVGSTIPALVFACIAPFFGDLVDRTSLNTALVVVGCAGFVWCTMFYGLLRREVSE